MKRRLFSLAGDTLFRRRPVPLPPAARFRPEVQPLEDRIVPSAGPSATPSVHVIGPLGSPSPYGGISPSQMRAAYGFDNADTGANQINFSNGNSPVPGDGSGQTIAIIDAYNEPNLPSDLAAFDAAFGLPAANLTVVNEKGGSKLPSADAGWGTEEALDVEWAHVIAPGARLLLVEASSSSLSDLITAINYARNQPGVSVVSMSWGSGEWAGEVNYDSTFFTPSGHAGVAFVASSGDSGSPGAPIYPSVSPNVIAVGGTQLSVDSIGDYLGETGWSGSGGGISAYEPQPGYQSAVVPGETMRTVPDVAYNASDSSTVPIYDTYGSGGWSQGGWSTGWVGVSGTSMGAPQWAGLLAIVDQGRALAGLGSLDGPQQVLPLLYQLAGSSDFHDITSGSNGNYYAGPGYDAVTGIGSPVANLLVPDLVNGSGTPAASGYSQFVGNVYELLLHRPADQGGLSFWIAQLNTGTPPSTVVADIEASNEYLTDLVASLYQEYLGRSPDAGAAGWIDYLAAGGSVEQVTAGILGSAEYFADHGGTNQGYLDALYQQLLGRPADAVGESIWLQAMAGRQSRQTVALGFLTSAEYRSDLVQSDYQTYLGRNADPSGLAGWLAALESGVSDQQVLAAILGSPEAIVKWS